MAGVIFLFLTVGLAVICILVCLIWGWVYDYKENKKKKAHPWYFQKLEEMNNLMTQSCRLYNKEIAPRKRLIDAILKDWDYLTDELRERKEKELTTYRHMIAEYQQVCDNLDNQVRAMREELKAYNKQHHLYKEYE